MDSIDNLREYVLTAPSICSTTRAILVGYIDGIEREVVDMVPLPVDADGVPFHIGDKVNSDHYEDGTVIGVHFFKAPNGVVFEEIAVQPNGWDTATWRDPDEYRHHRAPTVEDVLREFVERLDEIGSEDDCTGVEEQECRASIRRDIAAAYAEYAAKLRLAGDE